MAVRRSQEAVEMALRGALRFLGADYPKIHGVGSAFAVEATRKAPQMPGEVLEAIEQISAWLGEARMPSFYLQRECGEEGARHAVEDASLVAGVINKLFA